MRVHLCKCTSSGLKVAHVLKKRCLNAVLEEKSGCDDF